VTASAPVTALIEKVRSSSQEAHASARKRPSGLTASASPSSRASKGEPAIGASVPSPARAKPAIWPSLAPYDELSLLDAWAADGRPPNRRAWD
jgi:hypothetical protein